MLIREKNIPKKIRLTSTILSGFFTLFTALKQTTMSSYLKKYNRHLLLQDGIYTSST